MRYFNLDFDVMKQKSQLVNDTTSESIYKFISDVNGNIKPIITYHGSRGGIDFPIKPMSKPYHDFGSSFYMGTDKLQADALVHQDSVPMHYTLKIHLEKISTNRILLLSDEDWLYTIMANRGLSRQGFCEDYSKLNIAQTYINKCKNYDFVIGKIADDRMNEAINAFNDNVLTDQGLYHCLSKIDYGFQIAAKTDYACSNEIIEVVEEKVIKGEELDHAAIYSQNKYTEGKNIVKNAIIEYRNKGLYMNELVDKLREKEIQHTRKQVVHD